MSPPPYAFGSKTWPGLAKLIEEAGEVVQVGGKLLMTGGKADHWDGTDLKERLEDEIADLIAAAQFVTDHGGLDVGRIVDRMIAKRETFERWHREQA